MVSDSIQGKATLSISQETLSDEDIRAKNRLLTHKAKGTWAFGKCLGLKYKDKELEIIENLLVMEKRDGEEYRAYD